MHYKIVDVNENHPDKPTVYIGEFEPPLLGAYPEHPVITALNAQFGSGDGNSTERLDSWSGGEVSYWEEDLNTDDPDHKDLNFVTSCGDSMIYVFVQDELFKDAKKESLDLLAVGDLVARIQREGRTIRPQ